MVGALAIFTGGCVDLSSLTPSSAPKPPPRGVVAKPQLRERDLLVFALFHGVQCRRHTLREIATQLNVSGSRAGELAKRAERCIRAALGETAQTPELPMPVVIACANDLVSQLQGAKTQTLVGQAA